MPKTNFWKRAFFVITGLFLISLTVLIILGIRLRSLQAVPTLIAEQKEGVLVLVRAMLPDLFLTAEANPDLCGIEADASIEKASLGRPFRIYELTSNKVSSLKSDWELMFALEPTNQWCVPIDWGSGPGALASAWRMASGWQYAGVGGRDTLINFKIALSALDIQFGENFYFVRVYEKPTESTDLVIVPKNSSLLAVLLTGDVDILPKPALSLVRSLFEVH